ncbi:hypothetical protein PtA15_3A86 [Puccinia triticina]|uniref:F-box domain-containing protein n=1 Tax=Puccinia triticina TaxID=208348 RepID=A0ABY7CIT5_9BASI|nr:uncharacterized protein PtA15_3A86 [Puccinia triticina]WAQ82722.1 hypothetical protein PtA15_3A86 [Puccinia triticina]WAR53561.1 hypothetical protein PtB15_3B69 [Puccinia triticina]
MRRSRSLQLAPSQPEVDEACYAQQPLARKKQPSTSQPPAGHDHQEEPDKQLDFLSRLPIELALYILLKLAQHNDPRHLLSARAVSKSWQRLAEDSLIWKQLSQLIGLAQPTPHWTATSEAAPQLNWLKLFRDRYIIDRRWRHGSQLSKKLKGHKDSVYCLQMHDQQIITGSRDRTIKVWDSRSRECQRTLLGHKGSVLCVRFDAELLLSGSSDSSVFVWDRASWTVVRELVGHRSGVLDLGLTSTVFVSCSKDTTIKIWNRPDGALLRTITGHTGPVNALELSLQPLATLLNQPDPSPSSPPLSNALLSASGDSSMKLWDTHSGLLIRTFDGHLRGLACLKLVEHLRQIITGSNDETIKIWNLLTGQCLRTLLGHSGLVRSLDFSLRHNRLVSGSYDKTIKVWDLATGQLLLDFRKGTDRSLVFDVKFNLTSIVFVGHPNSIMLLDFADGLEADMFD